MKKICYGLAIPGLAMTLCLYCHVGPSVFSVPKRAHEIDTGKDDLCPHTPRLATSDVQFAPTLDDLAVFCIWCDHRWLYHRQCDPLVRLAHLAHRGIVRAYNSHHPIRPHVVARQLVRQDRQIHEHQIDCGLGCFAHSCRVVLCCRGKLWSRHRHYCRLQCGKSKSSMELRGQFKFSLGLRAGCHRVLADDSGCCRLWTAISQSFSLLVVLLAMQ